ADAPFGDQPESDAVAATVNGVEITAAEVNAELGNLLMQYRNRISPAQIEMMVPMFKQKALEKLIHMKLLVNETVKEQTTLDENTVDEKFSEISGRFPTPEEFEQQLSMAGLTKEKLRSDLDQNLKIEKLLKEKMVVESEVSDEAVTEYFEQNQETFQKPEEVKASHILISFGQEDTEETKKEKRDKLAELRQQIVDGADFAELASANSDCPSKAQGGDLGFFTREQMVPPFSEAAFNMEKDGLSEIVETQFGYHLIKTTDKHEAGVTPFEEVKEDIKKFLNMENEQKAFKKYIDELIAVNEIEYGEGFEPVPEESDVLPGK
ncbi:MAG: peptidylprolyl isomerase, partial [Planctomycetes bacterium]|nr:peptidylprolyl isomerase [Planctomycetota bacterium]